MSIIDSLCGKETIKDFLNREFHTYTWAFCAFDSYFLNGKKVTYKKLLSILKNNFNENCFLKLKVVQKKQPFYKGDYSYYDRNRLFKTKIYIEIIND